MRGTKVILIHLEGNRGHSQRFSESEQLWVTTPTLDTIFQNMYLRYCKRNFGKRIRGTWVIHVWTFQYPFKGGVGTHLVLSRISRTLSYTMKSWYNLSKHISEVLQKKFWKSNERNVSYSRQNLQGPLQGGVGTHSTLCRIWTASS
jgi:hypothetical protein